MPALFDDWRRPNAPVEALVDELSAVSPEFAPVWERHDVRHENGARKATYHPAVGTLSVGAESSWSYCPRRLWTDDRQARPGL